MEKATVKCNKNGFLQDSSSAVPYAALFSVQKVAA